MKKSRKIIFRDFLSAAELAALVLLTTAKVSQHAMNADADRAMLDSFLNEAGDEL